MVSFFNVAVRRWLRLRERIPVSNVAFYPAADAVTLLGDRGPLLAEKLRIYRDTLDDTLAPATVALHERQLHEAAKYRWV